MNNTTPKNENHEDCEDREDCEEHENRQDCDYCGDSEETVQRDDRKACDEYEEDEMCSCEYWVCDKCGEHVKYKNPFEPKKKVNEITPLQIERLKKTYNAVEMEILLNLNENLMPNIKHYNFYDMFNADLEVFDVFECWKDNFGDRISFDRYKKIFFELYSLDKEANSAYTKSMQYREIRREEDEEEGY